MVARLEITTETKWSTESYGNQGFKRSKLIEEINYYLSRISESIAKGNIKKITIVYKK